MSSFPLDQHKKPFVLQDWQQVEGILQAFEEYGEGYVVATIGEEHVIMPSDVGLKCVDWYGQWIAVLRLDYLYYVRKGRSGQAEPIS